MAEEEWNRGGLVADGAKRLLAKKPPGLPDLPTRYEIQKVCFVDHWHNAWSSSRYDGVECRNNEFTTVQINTDVAEDPVTSML